ncbi:hypothetical protein CHLRE_17g734300v5 [Chlamydomonas reinhardtii]|uniref:AIG1-type G domain-containing protein n=1 Tax=Chlamydomonas reinhardtii TaxID=3055 RepID=A0A2K3CR90_CHLRE|nr:uncharacterized protein CHLRE_17g734300v5 [Chlamydomonas reinhardtii]XP_042914959.1 uncharacterized protein CHLRE_17g734300v5 [Chlamydomonas reinhardtii]7XZI_9 Chain 9, Toc90 [Chlamydomonas reinhardtii]7XZJ_9 Chain 9, Toc90 [Chlamydomonas reinhardtii]PNW70794.1 hypothetical protein CHLRE_17g734300v5 [Chlamydomonas reinhardtii]PNW70795.1 hypothetical protein CHLRE_17g734300v5 [Chlamydomonas reinhardtii]
MGGGLPPKRSEVAESQPASSASSSAAAPAPAAETAGPKLPPRPAGLGLGGAGLLPSRGAAAAPSAGSATGTPAAAASSSLQQQQQQPAPPATQPAAHAAPAAPAGLGGAGLKPMLPPRPAAAAGAGAAGAAAAKPTPAPAPAAAPVPAAAPPPRPAMPNPAAGMSLPPRPVVAAAPPVLAAAGSDAVVDPSEDRRVQRVQRIAHDTRVRLIRAASRLGLAPRTDQVAQFLQAIERSERMVGAQHYKGSRRVDLLAAAEREARLAEEREGAAAEAVAGLRVKILVLGMTGTGKTELINSLLNRPAGSRTNAFREATRRVRVVRGDHNGIPLTFIDTPGLHASASRTADNRAILRAVRAAYRWHKPDYVFYVDRLDATRPGFGEMGLLGLITESLGAGVWRNTMAVLTHAHAARTAFGGQYDVNSRQRRNIVSQLLRQAAGDQQSRNPVFLADCHPACPTNSLGQPVILEGPTAVPWKQQLLVQLVGYKSYNVATSAFKDLAKAKAGKAAAGAAGGARGPQDIFKQMMRSRLPPMTFFVEQMSEGVLKPEGWATMETVAGLGEEVTEDEGAESFNHVYYRQMYELAVAGDPWAQREYAAMLRAYDKGCESYRASYEEADVDANVEYGVESYVVDPIDFGPSFDPEDMYSHRHAYAEAADAGVTVIPSQDYYGPEHDDPLNGIVFQYEAQPFSRHGWGGVPFDLTVCCEKDKTSLCLQGETHVSLVHSVPPFGPRHITQVTGSWEVLRPNIKDVMYQLEVDTFKDGLLGKSDHAGCGLMLARLGEGGDPRKGPTAVGVRLQDTLRVGPFKLEACASKVAVQGPTGGKEEGWGARAFVGYDWLPGLGMAFDFIQERTPEEGGKRLRGYGANFTYDWEALGAAFGMEVDYVAASESVFVSVNAFSGNDYRLGWLLLLPAVNYFKETVSSLWARLRGAGGGEGEEGEELEEEGEGEEGDDEEAMMMMAQEGDL